MAFDIAAIRKELHEAPPAADLPWEVGVAIVSDTFRLAGLAPPAPKAWTAWRRRRKSVEGQVLALAWALVSSSLRAETVQALVSAGPDAGVLVEGFLDRTSPLTAEMIRTNAFRQEEFLRCWVKECAGAVAGETQARSEARLRQLDYRGALAEYKKAEEARKREAARRAQLLREAAQRREYAKGWRE